MPIPSTEASRRRTFAIISHPDAGKTTLTEKLLLFSGAIQIAGSVKARKASPVEATKAALARVDAFNGQLNAFQHLDPDMALRAARASEKRLKAGELVTLDLGARLEGYHSDMTRTFALGRPKEELRRAYKAVEEALEAALAALAPGKTGKEVDAVARKALEAHGLDRYFVHSLGHGVGLAVHEEIGRAHV